MRPPGFQPGGRMFMLFQDGLQTLRRDPTDGAEGAMFFSNQATSRRQSHWKPVLR